MWEEERKARRGRERRGERVAREMACFAKELARKNGEAERERQVKETKGRGASSLSSSTWAVLIFFFFWDKISFLSFIKGVEKSFNFNFFFQGKISFLSFVKKAEKSFLPLLKNWVLPNKSLIEGKLLFAFGGVVRDYQAVACFAKSNSRGT